MKSASRAPMGLAIVLIVAFAALRFGFFIHEPPGRDQGMFSYLGDGILHGKRLYRDLWDHKPPGVVWLYALAIALLGRAYAAIHALQAVLVIATALAIAGVVRRTTGMPGAAIAAALLYVLHAGGLAFGGFWGTAQAELFMDLPLVVAVILLLAARDREGRAAWLRIGIAGLCVGSTLLLKYSAAPLIGLVVAAWPARGMRAGLPRVAAFLVGFALPSACLALGMALSGTWDDFVRATVWFNLDYRSATSAAAPPLLGRVFYAPDRLLALLVPGAVALAFALRQPGAHDDRAARSRVLVRVALLLWVLALTEVFWQGRYWVYHYQVVLLPLTLLAGAGLGSLSSALSKRSPGLVPAIWVGLVLLLLPYLGHLAAYDRRHGLSASWRGRIDAATMEATYTWGDYQFAQTKAIAAQVAEQVPAGERIFVWGFEPYVYFLAQRPSASRFQNDEPLMPRYRSVHAIFARELMEDLEQHPPRLMIVVTNDANDVEPEDSVRQLLAWPDLRRFVESRYAPAWRTGDFLCLARR